MKKALIFRVGAYGDLLAMSSICAGLKQQGYHVTVVCKSPSNIIISNDPNIDKIYIFNNRIKNEDLTRWWKKVSKRYDKFVNLSESMEGAFLQLPFRPTYEYSLEVRHALYNKNYLEHAHTLAQVPNIPQVKFYPTNEELNKASELSKNFKDKKIIAWALAGSGVHKIYPWINNLVANILKLDNVEVVLLGTPEQREKVGNGLENVDRVTFLTDLNVRDAYTFVQQYADLLISPETGIAWGMSQEKMKKIMLLSHSTEENLTKTWINTISLHANVDCCLHLLKEDNPNPVEVGDGSYKWFATPCMANINPADVWKAIVDEIVE